MSRPRAADTREGGGTRGVAAAVAAPGNGGSAGNDGGMRRVAAVRPQHLPADVLAALVIQLLGQGADVDLLALDLGLQLGDGRGLLVDLAAEAVLDALPLEPLALEAVGDADHLGIGCRAGGHETAGVDVARCGGGGLSRRISALGGGSAGPSRRRHGGEIGQRCRHAVVSGEFGNALHPRCHPLVEQLGLKLPVFFGQPQFLRQFPFHGIALLQRRGQLVLDGFDRGVTLPLQQVHLRLEDALVVQRFAQLGLQLGQVGRPDGRHGRHVVNERSVLLHGHPVGEIGVELLHLPLGDRPLLAQLLDLDVGHGPLLPAVALDEAEFVLEGLEFGILEGRRRGTVGIVRYRRQLGLDGAGAAKARGGGQDERERSLGLRFDDASRRCARESIGLAAGPEGRRVRRRRLVVTVPPTGDAGDANHIPRRRREEAAVERVEGAAEELSHAGRGRAGLQSGGPDAPRRGGGGGRRRRRRQRRWRRRQRARGVELVENVPKVLLGGGAVGGHHTIGGVVLLHIPYKIGS
mmetsp:Transcript_31906/g.93770  ORF Transcript_31906/g.93770 Transcript_31906/m.93770 type:complete len:522 (+) Transcript_31906:1115-2680(+)